MSVNKGWMVILAMLPLMASAGGSVDFSLSNTSVRVEHETVRTGTGAHITTGLLYSEKYGDSRYALSAGFNAVDATLSNRELIGGIGFKGFFFDTGLDPDAAISVGGFLRWQPDFMNGLGGEANLYFAPDILAFDDLEGFQEGIVRVTYKVLPQARVFVGWHDVSAYYLGGNRKVDNTVNLGFRMNY